MSKETVSNWKDGDVFLWSYNEIEYEARKNHHDIIVEQLIDNT